MELQTGGQQIPIYQADNSSDFSLNFIVPHDSQSIEGLVFFLLPSTSNSEGDGYVIRKYSILRNIRTSLNEIINLLITYHSRIEVVVVIAAAGFNIAIL